MIYLCNRKQETRHKAQQNEPDVLRDNKLNIGINLKFEEMTSLTFMAMSILMFVAATALAISMDRMVEGK